MSFAVHTLTHLGVDTGRILEIHSASAKPNLDLSELPLHPFYNYMYICGSGPHVHDWFPYVMTYINANHYAHTFAPYNSNETPDRACRINISPQLTIPTTAI